MKIKSTLGNSSRITVTPDQYSTLGYINSNRPVNQDLVKRMKMSVLRHGVLRLVIVVWDELLQKYVIVDGQHLSKALMQLNRNIECHIVDCDDENDLTQLMIDLNNISKTWTYNDYIHGWAESGKKSYKILRRELEESGLQLSIVLMAYTQKRRCIATKMMKDGTFEILDKKRGDTLISYIKDCNNYLPNTRAVNEALINIFIGVADYNHKQMLKNLKTSIKHITLESKESAMLTQLHNIYKG